MATLAESDLIHALACGGARVAADAVTLDLFAHDIFARGADLAAVVHPVDTASLAAAVKVATDRGLAVVPRGGGMSYTGGYTPDQPGAVLFDTATMNRIIEINETDMTVTVEAGCRWAALYEALRPRGLRTPFWGTLSGLHATVGGGMSQNGIFWGTGRYGTAAQSCVALEVVLADGTVLKTGSSHARPYGPDLTGIFLADTGALGIKATVTLRLVPEARCHGYASFTFTEADGFLAAMGEIERAGIATECFGFDPRLNAIRMQRDSLATDAKQLVGMMKRQGSVLKALKEGARVVAAGRNFIDQASFSMHVMAEAGIQQAADADIARAREIVARHRGAEVENTIPKIVRANPFGPLNSMLGPQGERWAPIHGLVPHSRAQACYDALDGLFAANAARMAQFGVHQGTLIAAVGGAGVVIEPCLYWFDARNPLIDCTVETAHLKKLPDHPHNPEIWAFVQELKAAIVDVFFAHKAVHFQIGRTYRYRDSLDPAAGALLVALKSALDPRGLMNPGSLGL
jgi:FAD/FMN-containing dehydrogenase